MATSKTNLAAVGLVIAVTAWLSAADEPRRPEPINVADLNERPVIGMLGQPLGTVVTIKGDVVDGSKIRIKDLSGKPVLQVARVNGQPVESRPILQFDSFRSESSGVAPAIGTHFAYLAYENGEFGGLPNEAREYVGPVASLGFRFRTKLVLLRDESGSISKQQTLSSRKSTKAEPSTGQRR
jgi:hypothetical protein